MFIRKSELMSMRTQLNSLKDRVSSLEEAAKLSSDVDAHPISNPYWSVTFNRSVPLKDVVSSILKYLELKVEMVDPATPAKNYILTKKNQTNPTNLRPNSK